MLIIGNSFLLKLISNPTSHLRFNLTIFTCGWYLLFHSTAIPPGILPSTILAQKTQSPDVLIYLQHCVLHADPVYDMIQLELYYSSSLPREDLLMPIDPCCIFSKCRILLNAELSLWVKWDTCNSSLLGLVVVTKAPAGQSSGSNISATSLHSAVTWNALSVLNLPTQFLFQIVPERISIKTRMELSCNYINHLCFDSSYINILASSDYTSLFTLTVSCPKPSLSWVVEFSGTHFRWCPSFTSMLHAGDCVCPTEL